MNGWTELDRFLRTDPRDVGCAQAMEMLHIYAELAAAGRPVEQRYPASPRTCVRADRAVRTSKGCWPRCVTRPPDRCPPLAMPDVNSACSYLFRRTR